MINFAEFLDEIKNGLVRFPGDLEILKEAVTVADRLLKEGDLDHTRELLETCIRNAKDSPLLVDIHQKLEFTHAWLAARRAAEAQNWQAAVKALLFYAQNKFEYSVLLKSDLQTWEKSANEKLDIPSLQVLYAFHAEIDPNVKDYLESSLKTLRLRDADLKAHAVNKHLEEVRKSYVIELENIQKQPEDYQKRISELQAFSGRVRLKMETISTEGQINRADFEQIALQSERFVAEEQQQLARDEAESEANLLKIEADSLSMALMPTLDDREEAIKKYRSAAEKFIAAGKKIEGDTALMNAQNIEYINEHNDEIKKMVQQARKSLDRVTENHGILPQEMLNVLLTKAMMEVSEVYQQFSTSPEVKELVTYAQSVASKINWDQQRFENALNYKLGTGKTAPTLDMLLNSSRDLDIKKRIENLEEHGQQTSTDIKKIKQMLVDIENSNAKYLNWGTLVLTLVNLVLIALLSLNFLPWKGTGTTDGLVQAQTSVAMTVTALAHQPQEIIPATLTPDAPATAFANETSAAFSANEASAAIVANETASAIANETAAALVPATNAPEPSPTFTAMPESIFIADASSFGKPGDTSTYLFTITKQTKTMIFSEYYLESDTGTGIPYCHFQVLDGPYTGLDAYTLCNNISSWKNNDIPAGFLLILNKDAKVVKPKVFEGSETVQIYSDFTKPPVSMYKLDEYVLFSLITIFEENPYCKIAITKSSDVNGKVNVNKQFYVLCTDIGITDTSGFIEVTPKAP